MEWLNGYADWIAAAVAVMAGGVAVFFFLRRSASVSSEISEEEFCTLKAACRLSRDALFIIEDDRVIFSNHAAEKLIDITLPATLKRLEECLIFYDTDEKHWINLETLLERHRLQKHNTPTLVRNLEFGKEKRIHVSVLLETPTCPEKGGRRSRYHIIAIQDTHCEKQLFDLRHLNTLSGLPNQYKAYSDITAITTQSNRRTRFAVIMIELDDASRLRSMLGYAEMDTIITHVANVLREMTQNSRIKVYHLNYVNFMILLQQPHSREEIYTLFEQFQLRVQESYSLLQNRQKISFSAGISLYPNESSLYDLINGAFGALVQAQERGKGHVILADGAVGGQQTVEHEILLNTEIEKGLKARDFKLYFQAIYDAKDERLAGAEVLLRWHHPDKGLLMPDLFIPIAERSGLVLEIGKYVIEESLKQLSRWNSFGFPPLQLSVNLSLRELENQEFIKHLTEMLERYETGISRLKFEITEHATMLNPQQAIRTLREIRQMGIGISLDDFGTGYSSFAYLAEFPIETLKIDRSFVTDMTEDSSKRHIVSTITKLGHSLGMTIVAEGVENKEEAVLLGSYGVDYLQGYYYSRPLPQLEFQYLLSHS